MAAEYKTIRGAESMQVTHSSTTSLAQLLTKTFLVMAVMVLALTVSSTRVNASTTAKAFEFGPGTVEMVTGWTSQVGCPSAWQVRVKTQNGAVPAGGVSGSITFDYQKPPVVNLDMVGDAISIERNSSKTKNLSGHDAMFGIANSSLIAGTGEFRIRAKWDAPFGPLFEDGYALKVRRQSRTNKVLMQLTRPLSLLKPMAQRQMWKLDVLRIMAVTKREWISGTPSHLRIPS